jgi:anti-anti-sigma factor
MPNNKLTIEEHDASRPPGLRAVTLTGSLTLETVAGFNQNLREEPAPQMLLDLTNLEWLDSAGVGALVQLLVRRQKAGNSLMLAGLSPRNNAVLQVAQVLSLFKVFPTSQAAIASLS